MTANTGNRAYPYPQSTDAPRGYEQIQSLAEAVDVDVQALITDLGVWTSFVPLGWKAMSTTPVAQPITVNYAKYIDFGKLVLAMANVTVTGTTTGGFGLDMPFTAATRTRCGIASISGASPPSQSGLAYMDSGKNKIVCTSFTNAYADATAAYLFEYAIIFEKV
jgi:hypothetical protein